MFILTAIDGAIADRGDSIIIVSLTSIVKVRQLKGVEAHRHRDASVVRTFVRLQLLESRDNE